MGKDKVEKEKKRAEKKEKRSDKDGIAKPKKEKKDKKDKTALADAVEKEITTQVLEGLDQAAAAGVADAEVDAMAIDRPVGAIVPFANPLVEDKQAKKVLKTVKKGMPINSSEESSSASILFSSICACRFALLPLQHAAGPVQIERILKNDTDCHPFELVTNLFLASQLPSTSLSSAVSRRSSRLSASPLSPPLTPPSIFPLRSSFLPLTSPPWTSSLTSPSCAKTTVFPTFSSLPALSSVPPPPPSVPLVWSW
jgi:hypothetical protein